MKPVYLLRVMLVMLLAASCSKNSEPDAPPTNPPSGKDEITLNEAELILSDTDPKGEISFKASADWRVSVSESRAVPGWLTVEPTSGKAGQATLTVTAQPNEDYDDRNAVITISSGAASKSLTIFQKKKNALILSKEIYELEAAQSTIDIEVKSNVDFEVKILDEWITQIQSRGLTTHQLKFAIEANTDSERTGRIVFKDLNSSLSDTISIIQVGMAEGIAQDREALIALYNATGGSNWIRNDNWCSDKPLDEWYGVCINYTTGRVNGLLLVNNNLSGYIPEDISKLTELESLNISYNRFSNISENIGTLQNLKELYLQSDASAGNVLTGEIPNSLNNLKNLKVLVLGGDFSSIPEWIGEMQQLEQLEIKVGKQIFGPIPEWIGKLINLRTLNIAGNGFTAIPECIGNLSNLSSLTLDGDFASLPELNNLQNLETLSLMGSETKSPLSGSIPEWIGSLKKLKHLVIAYFNISGSIPEFIYNLTELENLHLNNMNLTGSLSEKISNLKNLTYFSLFSNELSGPIPQSITSLHRLKVIDLHENNLTGNIPTGFSNLTELYTLWLHGNRLSGEIPEDFGSNPNFDKWQVDGMVLPQQSGYTLTFGSSYESTDFSADGQVVTLQKATTGQGVDIVLLGDGFVDRDMASGGKYEQTMQEACEYLFALEPMKSYREYFNVYAVKAVSKHERFGAGFETALNVVLGTDGRYVGGNDDKCFEYAQKAPIHTLDEITIAVVGNINSYGGTTFWHGTDASVGYVLMSRPIQEEYDYSKTFEAVFIHEVVGHGFGKLADEYVYVNDNFPADAIADENYVYENYGWNANISYTSDPEQVRWKHLLNDPRFSSYTGIVEGGNNYAHGVWRPEEQSMMRAQLPYFNAPSREAIVKRIMRLAGEEYSFEKFASKDKYVPLGTKSRSKTDKDGEIIRNPSPIIVRR